MYYLEDGRVIMVATDRISAFDVIMPRGIPGKGQMLNQLSAFMLGKSSEVVPNWWIASPDPNVSVGKNCTPFKVEMVIRGYLAGHAAREYKSGKRLLSGVPMVEGLRESDPFPTPIITPATKAEKGDHDEDISREDILSKGLVSEEDYRVLEDYTRKLFEQGSRWARSRGLLLVDTKYEFGKTASGEIVLIDEVHTPDSSRYYYADGYQERQDRGERQKQLSKEFLREWLIAYGFQGKEGQQVPELPDAFVEEVSARYQELYELVTGRSFEFAGGTGDLAERIQDNVANYLKK
jgi:phosphoribosylaminoimidazole-succinocarboxamide synthase